MKAETSFLPQADEQEVNMILVSSELSNKMQLIAREQGISESDAINEAFLEYIESRRRK